MNDDTIVAEEAKVMGSGAIKHMKAEFGSIKTKTGISLLMDNVLLARFLWGDPEVETASPLATDPVTLLKIFC